MIIIKNNGKGHPFRVNEEIGCREVRLIGHDGKPQGVIPTEKALAIAKQEGLDLVEVSPHAEPPVCKTMDYGKYLFELTKKQKEAKKTQKTVEIKEIWLKPNIENHDFNTKVKNAIRFLQEGDKVKVSLRFKGREMHYVRMSEKIIRRFAEECSEHGESEDNPRLEGRNMLLMLAPLQNKKKRMEERINV
ncbi:MAG: translation initiation factor IF-3 [Clostridia bacterium]